MFQLVSAYIQKQLCWCSANACLERLEPPRWILPSVSASLLKHSGRSECGIRKMSCFVFQTLILSRSVKLAIRKVSEIKCWDSWIQWTLRNSLHYISCDLRELRRVFLSCRLFWNINTNMSHTLITCSLFSLIIFESLVSEHLITLSSIQKLHSCFQCQWSALGGTGLRKCKFPQRHQHPSRLLVISLLLWRKEFFTIFFSSVISFLLHYAPPDAVYQLYLN